MDREDSALSERMAGCRRVFSGRIFGVEDCDFVLPGGKMGRREIVRHVGAAAVVPVDGQGNVILVRQYRAPVGKVLMELPAGKLNSKGEDRRLAAERELREETGYAAGSWTHLTDLLTTPGFCDEVISLYLATDLMRGEAQPDEDEFLSAVRLPFDEAVRMALCGELTDSKTIVGLLLARERL